jgi:hypothetical protein
MNHEEFQLAVGADPTHLDDEQRAHLRQCPSCATYLAELLELEARLGAALNIPVPARAAPRPARAPVWPYGLAAAAALVAVLVTALLVSAPRDALARSVAVHMDHEPQAFVLTAPVDPAHLDEVLRAAHVQILAGAPTVTYAQSCPLRGHIVPHLAVLTDHGPVVVMLLTEDPVSQRQAFTVDGYHGVIVPMARGSLAIISEHPEDFDAIVSLVASRIRYLG